MPLKVKAIARHAAEDALATSLRNAITVQLTEELNRVFSEPPLKDMLARVVRDAVGEVLARLDRGNGRPGAGFSRRYRRGVPNACGRRLLRVLPLSWGFAPYALRLLGDIATHPGPSLRAL